MKGWHWIIIGLVVLAGVAWYMGWIGEGSEEPEGQVATTQGAAPR